MSKINALRIINLNYNNNAIHVDDETFRFDGESTLMSLRNGGGKSVMVQMMIAPFVHKRYRNTEDRPFASFFTTNKPTFILVEWQLDSDAGYLITGMMVRKNSNPDTHEREELEIINIIGEYKERCRYDINNIPVIETSSRAKTLRSYGNCKQLFEDLKKETKGGFNYYDMTNSHHSARYFEHLGEYKINHKEWEEIIRKVNRKESGLSELFATAKDEKGLIEGWFIDTVESKLDKGKSRIKEFESIVEKYIKLYKDNQVKIYRKDVIRRFKEEAVELEAFAKEYKQHTDSRLMHENRIANLIAAYNALWVCNEEELADREGLVRDYNDSIRRIHYEEISYAIYDLGDKKEGLEYEYNSVIDMCNASSEELDIIQKQINIYDCAHLYEKYKAASRDLQYYESQLEIKKAEASDLEPERNMVGYNLRCRYQEERANISNRLSYLSEQIEENKFNIEENNLKLKDIELESQDTNIRLGALAANIESYSKLEEDYNIRFSDNLMRNILGVYEPATLDLKQSEYIDKLTSHKRELKDRHRCKDGLEEDIRASERALEDTQGQWYKNSARMDEVKKEIGSYNAELEERKLILRYLDLDYKELFCTDKIIDMCNGKIQEVEAGIDRLNREYSKIDKECSRLKQGKLMELPKNVIDYLEGLAINYTYGMEWIKKNSRSVQDNSNLIDNNPFIPYSIILNGEDIKKLQAGGEDVFTSWPIPIIKREELDKIYGKKESQLEIMDKVSFFVMFNKKLLDPDKLAILIAEKETELEKKKNQIIIRKEENRSYIEKKEKIRSQKVDKDLYNNANKLLDELIIEKARLDSEIELIKDKQISLKKAYDNEINSIKQLENSINKLTSQLDELSKLISRYGHYLSNREEQRNKKEKITKLALAAEDIKKRQDELRDYIIAASNERTTKNNNLKQVDEKLDRFLHYAPAEISSKDTEDLEATYRAITDTISTEQKRIEEDLNRANEAFRISEGDLLKRASKYKLTEADYAVAYDEFIETRLEQELQQKQESKRQLEQKSISIDKEIAVLESHIKNGYKNLMEKCDQLELIDRNKIVDTDFQRRINEQEDKRRKEEQGISSIKGRIDNYKQSLHALSQYNHLTIIENIDFQEDFNSMSYKDISTYNGILLRDYGQIKGDIVDAQGRIRDVLHRFERIEDFADDYFMKPIEILTSLLQDANSLLTQLSIILDSFQNSMDKLEIDIAYIGKERDKLIELLLDYIQEVHTDLGKIDKNSTIHIRGKSVKMLKLLLPSWEDNEGTYLIRMRDYIEELTRQAVVAIDNNENIMELIGKRITTKNLYNEVVGIASIGIRLYKIEKEKEYPITWAEVSKNSGGEGFLSAFVILSSLLYYMRRDETDLFAEKEEGKVLVMDNPFAQTNAAHLLKPLMDMAKKTNTQLICLSGLGGESIYNRFDNIYVLNLISSSLRRGMEYMKSERIKGSEKETEEMILARVKIEDGPIETYEQNTLF